MSKFKFVDYTTKEHIPYAGIGPRVIEKVSVIYINNKLTIIVNGQETNCPSDVTAFVMDLEV